jgi:hypothetical protein
MYRQGGGGYCVYTHIDWQAQKKPWSILFFSSCRIFLVPFSSYSYYSLSYLSFVLWLFSLFLSSTVLCVAAWPQEKAESLLLVGWKARFRHSQLASGPVICHSSAIDDSLSSVLCCLVFFPVFFLLLLLLLFFFSDINKTESLRGDASQRPKESSKDRSSLVNEAILTAKDLLALRNI